MKTPSPTLAAAFEKAIASHRTHPRGATLAQHLAAVVSDALAQVRRSRVAAPASAARSAVDVLTDNELADAILDLKNAVAQSDR